MPVFRCFTERREGFDIEADRLVDELSVLYGIKPLSLRIFNRYDVEGIDRDVFVNVCGTIMSEPQTDMWYDDELPDTDGKYIIAVEALPGQYDQRADSCAQCIQIMTRSERPVVATAKVYVFNGILDESACQKIKAHLINPVETREALLTKPESLKRLLSAPEAAETLNGFIRLNGQGLDGVLTDYGLAMDTDDLAAVQRYFTQEGRDPTETELKVIDTYWSDHCRHTTFATSITDMEIFDDEVQAAYREYLDARKEVYRERADDKPVTLMDVATMGMRLLKKRGMLPMLDESDEINACSVKIKAMIEGEPEDWMLMFKNETHNHPTEIEPFGGAATCLGGAIRDPLSGRSYVYQAMRVSGAGDPTVSANETQPGKLPQRKLTRTAAAGFSSYGNQIGLATGIVDELYHPGYVAKRLELGAVVGAAPAINIVRKRPEAGDVVILLGDRTGRDGIGGAAGSSKPHTVQSLSECTAEVQKGNPPEERKIQRLFRNQDVTLMIKRCNDFGAGGVSVAIGELADGLIIDLDKLPKKYEGLNTTELAISESQERMAVVVSCGDAEAFIKKAELENLEATVVARVTAEPRLVMLFNGSVIVDISRKFLNSNGAEKHALIRIDEQQPLTIPTERSYQGNLRGLVSGINSASKRGLVEMFDSSIGAASVLMPFGGKTQLTPTQSMAALLPVTEGKITTCSVMAYGFDPYISEQNPYLGAIVSVTVSLSKLVAAGCDYKKAYLTLQEYFERLRNDPQRWGKPFMALLGAFKAQKELGIAAIGGKDSMSGSFMELDVPPTLVSFAIAVADARDIISPEFKSAGNAVYMFAPTGIGDFRRLAEMWECVHSLIKEKVIISAWVLTGETAAEGIIKMSFGNGIGFKSDANSNVFTSLHSGAIIVESTQNLNGAMLLGFTTDERAVDICENRQPLDELIMAWEQPLEKVFPTKTDISGSVPKVSSRLSCPLVRTGGRIKPRAVIPVFPGTNCEYDTMRAVERAGGTADTVVIRNLSPAALEESVKELERAINNAQMLILPGGFSGGDEPDGSAKFITAFFRNSSITEATYNLLYKNDGLMLGICNGFQALVKLGLLPYGKIRAMDEDCPTLTHNLIGRHQSRYVLTRVSSVKTPWLSACSVGDIHAVPVSHGEGRFIAKEEAINTLANNGQIAFQYVDANGNPSMDISVNPNGSVMAIEGIISPDGRILGKMGHSERSGVYVAKNIPFNKHQPLFESGVKYFSD